MSHLRRVAVIFPTFVMLKVIITGSDSEKVLDSEEIVALSLTLPFSSAEATELDVACCSLCVLSFFPKALVGSLTFIYGKRQ